MKIAVITCNSPYQRYFVNKINKEFGISALFIVEKEEKRLSDKFNRYLSGIKRHWSKGEKSIAGTIQSYRITKERNKLLKKLYPNDKKKKDLKKNILVNGYKKLDYKGPVYREYRDVNTIFFQNKMKEVNPDILLVFGGPIVGNEIINAAKIAAINLHWGLSPYYRGGRTTIWPIYNNEPEYIGVTIHRLSQQIDGGEIITQDQPELSADDNIFSVELKLSKLGTALVLKTLRHIKQNNSVPSTKQNFEIGKLYLSKHLKPKVLENVKEKLENSFFEKYLPLDAAQKDIDLTQHL